MDTRTRHRPRHCRSHPAVLSRWAAATAVLALVLASGAAEPAYADYALIEGSGSTWSQGIVDQWIADVDSVGIHVAYNGSGSSQGRKDFANKTNDFAISEIPYQGTDEFGNADSAGSRAYVYLPIVAGGTAFTYQIRVGGELMRDVRLSGETIAKIFTNQITNWNDPQIAADNNGRTFPDLAIIPVVRSDGSGTTAQFTTWLDNQHSSIWRPYFGRSGFTSYYPNPSGTRMIAADKSDGVMNTISAASGNGTIGYVEYSYPLNKGYPVVKVLNSAGYFVEPTQYNVAVALTRAEINQDPNSQNYLTQVLDGVYANSDPRAYPLSSYSYMILPTGADDPRLTTNKRQSLADFMFYALCEGQSKAGPYGYSPLPLNLAQAGFEQLAKLGVADPGVDLQQRDVTRCNNPTFVAGDLSRNYLAEIAPAPAACDQSGAGPCLGTGQNNNNSNSNNDNNNSNNNDDDSNNDTGTNQTGGPTSGAVIDPETGLAIDPETGLAIDPETGLLIELDADGTLASGSVATTIPARPAAGGWVFGALAAAELAAIVLIPGLLAMRARRRVVGP